MTTAPTDSSDAINEEYIKIRVDGLKLPNPPAKGESVTLIVKGTCREIHDKTMKDGEDKVVHYINADSIYERGKVPIVDENPKGLFDFVSDQRLWETAKDAAFEKGENLDDVVSGWLRDYINGSGIEDDDPEDEPEHDDQDDEPSGELDLDTKVNGDKVIRPDFSDTNKDDD